MPIPRALFDALRKGAPVLGPEAVTLAKKALGAKQLKKTAHAVAWERRGRVGEVTFMDGGRRWVVVDAQGSPLAAFPQYGRGDREELVKVLEGVDLDRCMKPPAQELKELRAREKEARRAEKAERKREPPELGAG